MIKTRAAAIIAALLFASFTVGAAPYVPSGDDVVLAKVPTRFDLDARRLAALRQQLRIDPEDVNAATAYAREAIKIGHARSDPRYYGYAEAALSPWWTLDDAPQQVLIIRAAIHQFFHAFEQAINDLDRALMRNPHDSQARLIRATIYQVQGYPEKALADCQQLPTQVDSLISITCESSASSLMGRGVRAYAVLSYLLDQSKYVPTDSGLWAETLRAEIAERLGRTKDAQAGYQRALLSMDRLSITDAYLLAAWADFAIKQGQAARVIDRLTNLTDIDNLLLRLALAEQAAGGFGNELALHKKMLDERFAAARQRGDVVHLREEAMYRLHLLSDAASALRLAQQNWRTQREPIDALILLQAAQAAHQPEAVEPVRKWMVETRIEDQRLISPIGAGK